MKKLNISELHIKLDLVSKSIKESELEIFVTNIENTFIDYIYQELFSLFNNNGDILIINKQNYHLKIAEDLKQSKNLIIALKSICNINEKRNTNIIKIDNYKFGRFTSFTLITPLAISINLDSILSLVLDMYNIFYSWLQTFVISKMKDLEDKVSSELYFILQRTFSALNKKDLLNEVWLCAADPKNRIAFHLIGGNKNNIIASNLDKINNSEYSNADLIFEFYTNSLNYDEILARSSIEKNKVEDFSFNNAPYKINKSKYLLSEELLFDNKKDFTIFPINPKGKCLFFIACKREYRVVIEPVVNECIDNLKNVINTNSFALNKIHNYLSRKLQNNNVSTEIGKFWGGFLSGFTQ